MKSLNVDAYRGVSLKKLGSQQRGASSNAPFKYATGFKIPLKASRIRFNARTPVFRFVGVVYAPIWTEWR